MCGFGLAYKYWTRMEATDTDERTSLLLHRINYDCKFFCSISNLSQRVKSYSSESPTVRENKLACLSVKNILFLFTVATFTTRAYPNGEHLERTCMKEGS